MVAGNIDVPSGGGVRSVYLPTKGSQTGRLDLRASVQSHEYYLCILKGRAKASFLF